MSHRPTISSLLTLLLCSSIAKHATSTSTHHSSSGAAVAAGLSYGAAAMSQPMALHARGGSSDPNYAGPAYGDADAYPTSMEQQESFQDRIDAWKKHQSDQYASTTEGATGGTAAQQASLRDAEGRMKLITSVSKGSRSLIFFLLLWRDVHLYEVADTTLKGLTRLMVVTPLCALFLANLAGVVASVTSPSHSAKKRLKAILNLDKLVEALLICYNFIRLTILPAQYIPREVYIANTLHSVFFLLQSQAFTRVTWDEIDRQQGAFTDRPPPPTSYGAPAYQEESSQQQQQYGGYEEAGDYEGGSYQY